MLEELSKKMFQLSSLFIWEEIFITGFNRSNIIINKETDLNANNNLYHFFLDSILYKYNNEIKPAVKKIRKIKSIECKNSIIKNLNQSHVWKYLKINFRFLLTIKVHFSQVGYHRSIVRTK